MKPYHHFVWMLLAAGTAAAQEAAPQDESKERVQYTLILPDEKTPEVIKADENNPFEAVADKSVKEGDTEENRVRDILLSMPAKGGGSGPNGMRVMLGSIRLEAGQTVPNVLPDQQVKLQVKSITPTQIEMVWVEKKPTGLPPKPFVINVDVSPRIRYRMPSGTGGGGSGIGTIRMEGLSAFTRDSEATETRTAETAMAPPPSKAVAVDDAPAEAPTPKIADSAEKPKAKSATSTQPAANVPEASVLRMLFGNHAQKPR